MPEGGEKRSGRTILLLSVVAVALGVGCVGLFFYALSHPHEIGVLQLGFSGLIALGVAMMAIGVWRRRARGS